MPHVTTMVAGESAVLVVDVQEKLMVKIPGAQALTRNIAFAIDGARLTGVEVFATEQYPQGLGPTVADLAQRVPRRLDKTTFSCCGASGLLAELQRQKRQRILLVGIEAHVCVMNTALDLLAAGFTVYLAVDAIGSRFAIDQETAVRRLDKAGAILTTVETAVFEWTADASHANFKKLSALVKERARASTS